jgi:hypothetical protein
LYSSVLVPNIIEINFDGYSSDLETTGEIVMIVTDSVDVRNLNKLKNLSKPKLFGNVKGTDYIIRLIYKGSATDEQLHILISKSINSEPTIEYGSGTIFDRSYKNGELVDYVESLIMLKKIRDYDGNLNQVKYDAFIQHIGK